MAPSKPLVGVPFQPGMTVLDHSTTDFKRKSRFGYSHGVMTVREPHVKLTGEMPPPPSFTLALGADGKAFGKTDAFSGKAPLEARIPDYAREDAATVLRYQCFFTEPVENSAEETVRVRKFVLLYYVLDGSIQISEPRVENSGMPQATFLRRQLVPGVSPESLRVGETVTIFGRSFTLADADPHTRKFMKDRGVELAPPQDAPVDLYAARRDEQKSHPPRPRSKDDDLARYAAAKNGAAATTLEEDKLHDFLVHDKHVLRFFMAMDERDKPYGEMRPFILHFYLSDHTGEILEVRRANSGMDPFPAFLQRGRLYKDMETLRLQSPLHHTSEVVGRSGRLDPSRLHYFDEQDFVVGAELEVRARARAARPPRLCSRGCSHMHTPPSTGRPSQILGRRFLIYGCDDYTRTYYKEVRGAG